MKDFKVRCISDDGSGAFTTGKIYEFKDGKSKNNNRNEICFESVDELNKQFHSQFELVEESKMFTKGDLKVNDWCVQRNAEVYRIAESGGTKLLIGEGSHGSLDFYNENLTYDGENYQDIMKVYRPKEDYGYQLIRREYRDGELVFDREKGIGCEPPIKEITVSEATKLLTEKFGENVRILVGK